MSTNIWRDFQICIIVPLIILKGFSVAKSCFRPESVLLKLSYSKISVCQIGNLQHGQNYLDLLKYFLLSNLCKYFQ